MTFLLKRREMLRTTTKPSRIVFVLVAAAAAVSVGYITALAILAPEQLAEATVTASDVVCSGCVGTTDIANSAVTGAKIGSGQVKNSDIGANAVTSGKIADGQVFSSDIADVTIGSADIADSAITSSKLAGGAVKPNLQVVSEAITMPARSINNFVEVNCPGSSIITGGGFSTTGSIFQSGPSFPGRWIVGAHNNDNVDHGLRAFAICLGPSP